MALTLDQLRRLCDQAQFKYFVDPTRPALLCGVQGLAGRYQFVMLLDLEGQFLQFRTIGYANCAASHRHVGAVLRVLGDLNYKLRFVKFGWDPADGEIVVYADVWLMDGGLTQQQFARMLGNYLPSIDQNSVRISQTIETGQDPGEADPVELLKALTEGGGSLADRLRKLFGGKGKPEAKPGPGPTPEPDIEVI